MRHLIILFSISYALAAGASWPLISNSDVVLKNESSATFCPQSEWGSPCLMNWNDAVSYCRNIDPSTPNAHSLANIRAFANFAVAHGSALLELSEVSEK